MKQLRHKAFCGVHQQRQRLGKTVAVDRRPPPAPSHPSSASGGGAWGGGDAAAHHNMVAHMASFGVGGGDPFARDQNDDHWNRLAYPT
jgi:hypothetical protein